MRPLSCLSITLMLCYSVLGQGTDDRLRCPDGCRCMTASRTIYCNAVLQVPQQTLPSDFLVVSFCQERPFSSSALYRSNMTRFGSVERVFMSRCGLETIEPGAFSEVRGLKVVDLTQNRLRAIEPYTFQGMQIETLFLSGNANLRLNELSFADLQVQNLKLDNCSFKQLALDVLLPLRDSGLRTLALHNNELSRLSADWHDLLLSLTRIELHNNAFACDCSMRWLIELYQSRRASNSSLFGSSRASIFELFCNQSAEGNTALVGRSFLTVNANTDLQCSRPVLTDVRVDMTQDDWILVCSFEGNPMPTALVRSGNTSYSNQFVRRLNASIAPQKRIELSLPIPGHNESLGEYRCEALNEMGVASVVVDLSLPRVFYRALALRNEEDAMIRTSDSPQLAARRTTDSFARSSAAKRRDDESMTPIADTLCSDKQFSMIEMVIAVVSTFIASSLLSFVIFRVAQLESVGDFFKSARSHNYTLAERYAPAQRGGYLDESDLQPATLAGVNLLAQAQAQAQAVNGSTSAQSFRSLSNPADSSVAQVHLAYRPQPPRPSRAQCINSGNFTATSRLPSTANYNTSASVNEFRHPSVFA